MDTTTTETTDTPAETAHERVPLAALLSEIGACEESRAWAGNYGIAYEQAWAECPDARWLIWLASKAGIEHRVLVLVSCDIAEDALGAHWKGGPEPQRAIDVARAWTRGEANRDDVWTARRAARSAAADAYAAAYAAAAAAADAAYAAAAAAADAYAAYAAAYAAAAAAADAAADAARTAALRRCCDAVRAHVSLADVLRGLGVAGEAVSS
jgi:hypothetical protein